MGVPLRGIAEPTSYRKLCGRKANAAKDEGCGGGLCQVHRSVLISRLMS